MSSRPSPPEPCAGTSGTAPAARPRCPEPADFPAELAAYEAKAQVGCWDGPHYRMAYRSLGQGPPLVVVQGLASTYRGYAPALNRLARHFRTIIYDYPGEVAGDGARLGRIGHDELVADLFGLLDHLGAGRACAFGSSFGSTILLRALHRAPERFPRAVLQGGFARRPLTRPERAALCLGRLLPGTMARLPLRQRVLVWNNRSSFPEAVVESRWPIFVEENGRTSIAGMAHRLDMLARIDLVSILPEIPVEILLIRGGDDRIVPRRHHDELCAGLAKGQGVIVPLVGHQPHYTHPEALADAVAHFLLPDLPGCGGAGPPG